MTSSVSAEPAPRMALEHSIEFSTPIVGIGISEHPSNPFLVVVFDGREPQVVRANTGTPLDVRDDEVPVAAHGPQLSLRVTDLVVRVDGTDIVVHHDRPELPEIRRLTGHTTQVTSLELCPTVGEPLLVSGSAGGSVRIWDPRTGEQVRQSEPSWVSVLLTYLGPDGLPRIVSGGRTGQLRIWNPLLPVPPRTGMVSTRGFSDRVARQDLLDRGTLVKALSDLLQPGDDDTPTVITVEGAWGSGKSTLLELVKDKLPASTTEVPAGRRLTVFGADRLLWRPRQEKKEPEKKEDEQKEKPKIKPLVVSFNPWRHQSSEQVWAGLAKAVTEAAESVIMPHPNARERYWFTRNATRVDRRHLQRQLWRRTFSPLLSLAGLSFGLSVLNALTNLKLDWAWWVTAGLAVAGVLHTGLRYLFGRASAFLPGELFAGPVVSNAFSGTTTDPLIRDPYYHARAGYLYLVQHDVQALLEDLKAHDYQVILLIDDLDRCTPRTTAQVFEAINVFLSDDFPATRFVLGLDTTVVASHVDHAYRELADANIVTHPDDPSPGWTFLRKLVQLPVRLPRTTADSVDQVLLAQLGPVHSDEPSTPPPDEHVLGSAEETDAPKRLEIEQEIIAIEHRAEVRGHLRHRLRAQPEQSVREEKRLLNVWQFYLRVLGTVHIGEAGHLVAVAEIATRWPAYLHRLRGNWQDLADAVDDHVQWGATIARLGFARSDRKAAENLRKLLADCDAQAVAALANRLF